MFVHSALDKHIDVINALRVETGDSPVEDFERLIHSNWQLEFFCTISNISRQMYVSALRLIYFKSMLEVRIPSLSPFTGTKKIN